MVFRMDCDGNWIAICWLRVGLMVGHGIGYHGRDGGISLNLLDLLVCASWLMDDW